MNKQEKNILIFITCMITVGIIYHLYNYLSSRSASSNISIQTSRPRAVPVHPKTLSESKNILINPNKATQEELESIPGIGPVLAQRIIQYRILNGNYTRVEDLLKIKGIGAKKLDAIKSYIVFSQ